MKDKTVKSIAIIVAHPDDETLWVGGTILSHPGNNWFVVCVCRASDTDRSTRFYNTLKLLKAEGIMGDADDGPDQHPLDEKELENEILQLLPSIQFDLIITHNSTGEYTRHLRHEEVNKAVIKLWHNGDITAKELWTFAYEDGNKAYFPQIIENADIVETLSEKTWAKKYKIITKTYGYDKDSWEAETTPTSEAFWRFRHPHEAIESPNHSDNMINNSELSVYKLLSKPQN